MNGTMGTNSTMTENGNSTYLSNIFDLAAQMGASSVFLYSEQAEVSFRKNRFLYLSLESETELLLPSTVLSTQLHRECGFQSLYPNLHLAYSRDFQPNSIYSIRVSTTQALLPRCIFLISIMCIVTSIPSIATSIRR